MNKWGTEDSGHHDLETRFCDESDFLDDENYSDGAGFYPLSHLSEITYDEYGGRYKCLADPDKDMRIHGNYQNDVASNLKVVFERCRNETSDIEC